MPVLPPRENFEGPKVMASFRVPAPLMQRLRQVAKAEHYDVTEVVLYAIKAFLAAYDAEKEPKGKK
jgi:predicted transcriptional regulator